MKIYPDGTLEGTAEELAAYQSKIKADKMPLLHGHKPTGHKQTPLEAHRLCIPGLGQQGTGNCIYIGKPNPDVVVTFNQA